MAKAKKTTDTTDLQAFEDALKARGLEYDLFEYSHAFVDVRYKDEDGTKQLVEFKPDGSELKRDERGAEVL
jgi:hypothetical protein